MSKKKLPWPFGRPTMACLSCQGSGANRNRLQAAWTSADPGAALTPTDLACASCGGRGRVFEASGLDPATGEPLPGRSGASHRS